MQLALDSLPLDHVSSLTLLGKPVLAQNTIIIDNNMVNWKLPQADRFSLVLKRSCRKQILTKAMKPSGQSAGQRLRNLSSLPDSPDF